jgi:hypothetical protein
MTTIHVIDDNDVITDELAGAIRTTLATRGFDVGVERWTSAREVSRSWEESLRTPPAAGDVAICDLFSIKHYEEEAEHHPPARSRPGSAENVKRASRDSIKSYFPTLIEHELRVVVLSYVFRMLESRGDANGAELVRRDLLDVGVDEASIFEKPERQIRQADLEPVITHVLTLVGAAA